MFDWLWKNNEDKVIDRILNMSEHIKYTPGDVILITYRIIGSTGKAIVQFTNSFAEVLTKQLDTKVYVNPIIEEGPQGVVQIIVFGRGSWPEKLNKKSNET